jgi:hypothetical protein
MRIFGKRKCGYTSTTPFRVKCDREIGHSGLHAARGMRWDANGRIKFGGRGPKGGGR